MPGPAAAPAEPPLRRLARAPAAQVTAFFLAHLALCRLGDLLTVAGSQYATFWPASGLAVAALLLAPSRRWGWILAAVAASGTVSSATGGRPVWLSIPFTAGDLVEAWLAAWLLRRALGAERPDLGRVRQVMALVLLGAGASALLGSLPGTSALAWRRGPDGPPFLATWRLFWSGDALGILLVTPFALLLGAHRGQGAERPRWTLARAVEAAALAASVPAAATLVFGTGAGLHLERSYLLLPVLGWAAFRFGTWGAATASLAAGVLSAWATAPPGGAASPAGVQAATFEVQALLGLSSFAALVLAATLEERSRAAAALQASEARMAAFLEHSPAPLFLLDADGRLAAASRSFERMMGQPLPRLLGGLPPDMQESRGADIAAEDARILATGEGLRVDRRVAGRTYDLVKFHIPAAPRPMIGAVAVDVTDQRLTQRTLRLAQVALERTFTALLFLDPGGVVTYANEAATALLDEPAERLLGRSIWELVDVVDEAGWPEAWGRLRRERTRAMGGRLRRRSGRDVDVEVELTHVALERQEYAVLAARDLTERKRAEGAERLAAMGTLAAGMAHEINNPLTFVAANLAFALDRLQPLRPDARAEEAWRALEDAEEGTRRVARIVRDLKAVSRVEGEGRRPVDLLAEVETALKLAQHELRHRAEVEVRLGPVPQVEAEEFQLGQVVLNLLLNAAQALPEGEAARHRVTVTTWTSPDGWAAVEVRDTGPGIPAAVRARIFEPFFTTKPVGQGTGLGLSVCHGLVLGLGGRIEVESEPGHGAAFRVLLPPAAPPSPAGGAGRLADAPAVPAAPARGRILVVDDEALIGSTIRRILSTHQVEVLTDPRQALARLLDGEPFDLVLCDLMMPELTGMDLHAALRSARPGVAARMAFMTGGAFTDRARAFLETCGAPQLQKPFTPQDLRDAVRGWLAVPPGRPLAPPAGGAAP